MGKLEELEFKIHRLEEMCGECSNIVNGFIRENCIEELKILRRYKEVLGDEALDSIENALSCLRTQRFATRRE